MLLAPGDGDRAAIGRERPRQHVHEGGFAGAVMADEADAFAGRPDKQEQRQIGNARHQFAQMPPLRQQLYREADAFLNVTGAQEIRDEQRACKRRVYVESDPFASQVKVAKGDAGMIATLAAHDTLFSFGENLGAPDCGVPLERFRWLPTRQPVALELWEHALPPGTTYNTITTWHNRGKDLEYRGQTWYWTKDREFEKFLELPRKCPARFELAATVDAKVKARLQQHGWQQTDSIEISKGTDRYRGYI